jgi:O-antigen biosynthesis protein WbqV
MRPGERLNEILFGHEEMTVEIGIKGILAATPRQPSMQALRAWTAILEEAVERDDRSAIKGVLMAAVPEFCSQSG